MNWNNLIIGFLNNLGPEGIMNLVFQYLESLEDHELALHLDFCEPEIRDLVLSIFAFVEKWEDFDIEELENLA